jgi:putative selenate reductase
MATKGKRALGFFDCAAAPCQETCPTHQNVPDYMWLVAHGKLNEAADVILRTNALPNVTGCICDHPCMERCVRNHCDAPLNIREIKRFAIEHGTPTARTAGQKREERVAIVGAGPSGLSAAFYLAQAGFPVTIFEARNEIGGTPKSIIPPYRMGPEAMASDVERIKTLGVEIKLGVRVGKDVTLSQLREQGFRYTFLGIGASAGKRLGIPGEDAEGVVDALAFLEKAKTEELKLGTKVLVVGGGNSAMDAARTARRLARRGTVDLVYRRTRAQMPADPEEIRACLEEKIGLRDLLAPLRIETKAKKVVGLVCGVMRLGAPDASGRPRPEPTGQEITLPCSTLIYAVSQEPVLGLLEGSAVERNRDGSLKVDSKSGETSIKDLFAGGDVARGPASIVKAVADGRRFAEEIARRHGVEIPAEPTLDKGSKPGALLAKKAVRTAQRTVRELPVNKRKGFEVVPGAFDAETATIEASRCLDCDELCSLCVTVCPNRANQAYVTRPMKLELPGFTFRGGKLEREARPAFVIGQSVQTFNLGDSCNECGNCKTFCPTAGAPYQDKPRFWLDPDGFETAKGNAFRMTRYGDRLQLEAKIDGQRHTLTCDAATAEYRGPKLVAKLKPEAWELIEASPAGQLAEGEQVDLSVCETMIVLLAVAPVLPI